MNMDFPHTVIKRFSLLILTPVLCCACLNSSNQSDASDSEEAVNILIDNIGSEKLLPKTTVLMATLDPELEALGKELFFSKSLSGNFDVACASCHHPLLGGGDGLSLPVGESAYHPDLLGPGRWQDWETSYDAKSDGSPNVPRHSPTTFNSALYDRSMFFDGRVFVTDTDVSPNGSHQTQRTPDSRFSQNDINAGENLLATQARFPVTSKQEMQGFNFTSTGSTDEVREALADRIRGDTDKLRTNTWLPLFQKAFRSPDANAESLITYENIQTALAQYQASQILINNPWYDYVKGNNNALTDSQKRGAMLFFTAAENGGAGCSACHSPPIFSDEKFHNIAMPQFGRGKQANGEDFGRRGITQNESDRYLFRTPTLLNINDTAPYGHTGAFTTLRAMIKHHLSPEQSIEAFDFSFSDNAQLSYVADFYSNSETLTRDALSALIRAQQSGESLLPISSSLSEADISDLENFLLALTDPCVKDAACMARWIPDADHEDPDNQRLVARFSDHSPPPAPLRPMNNATAPGQADIANGLLSPLVDNSRCENGLAVNNTGGYSFTDVTAAAGITASHTINDDLYNLATMQPLAFSGGAAAADIDNDCWPEIYYMTGPHTPDILYKNDSDGSFSDISDSWKITHVELGTGAAFADIDGDGDQDLITTKLLLPELSSIAEQVEGVHGPEAMTIYKNDTDQFSLWLDHGIQSSAASWSIALADVDADEDLDVLTTHWRLAAPKTNHFWRNTDAGFIASNNTAGLTGIIGNRDHTWTGLFADINGDFFPDILMAADFEDSQVYINNGVGGFNNVTTQSQITDQNAMGAAVIDYDNDGDLDWFVSSIWDPAGDQGLENWGVIGNKLYQNNNGQLTDVTQQAGVAEGNWGWGACFADFNNDSWPDIFHVNGFAIRHLGLDELTTNFARAQSRLFISNRDGSFNEQSTEWGITDTKTGRAAICFDYDRDGDIDIFVTNNTDRPILYRNNSRSLENTHFINIRLLGLGKNTQAIGAKVYVTANGVTQLQEVKAGGGFLSSSPSALHFGLGGDTVVDTITIEWPRPHLKRHRLQNIDADQFITIHQPHE